MKKDRKKQVFNALNQLGQKLSGLADSKALFAGNTDVSETTPVELTTQGQDVLKRIIVIIKQHRNLSLSAGSFDLTKMDNEVGISNSALLDIHRQIRSIKEALKKRHNTQKSGYDLALPRLH